MSSVQLVARRIKPQCVIYDFMCSVTRMIFLTSIFIRATSCTLRGVISCVACILMHDQTTQGTLFKPFGIHDFVRSVPRMIFLTSIFIRATSCTLRGVISCVACILMHDQTTQGTLFKPFGIHDFVRSVPRMIFLTSIFIRATSCTLRGRDFIL